MTIFFALTTGLLLGFILGVAFKVYADEKYK